VFFQHSEVPCWYCFVFQLANSFLGAPFNGMQSQLKYSYNFRNIEHIH